MYGLGRVSNQQAEKMMADAKEEGFEAVRFWAFEPTDKTHFEFVCNLANKYELFLLPCLADKWGFLQDYKINNQWYTSGYKKSYLKYVNDAVYTFRDREEIIIWEIINEPVTSSFEAIFNFTKHVTEELKNINSNHLFSIGTVGGIGDKFGGPFSIFNFDNFKNLYSLPGLDAISIHDYSHDSTFLERLQVYLTLINKPHISKIAGFGDNILNKIPDAADKYWINKTGRTMDFPFAIRKIWRRYNNYALELAKKLNKPIYAGEVGFKREHGGFRNQLIEFDFRKKLSGGFSGYMLWSYESTGASYDAHGYGINVGEVKESIKKLKIIRNETISKSK
ncbi:MAG TPA: cellulase family glycosylhydrolase [Ignavibacteria bacterium]|jgi:hypothetical protein